MQRSTVIGAVLFSLAALPAAAGAQMVVHAISGTVKTVDAHTLDVAVNSGNVSEFKIAPSPAPALEFDNSLRTTATEAARFNHPGDFAVVYYYGFGSDQTAVALQDLGPGPFQKVQGTVTAFDKHTRALTLKDDAGQTHTLTLSDHLVVDEETSVAEGRRYSPHKGERLVVMYSPQNQAVFLGERI